MLKSFERWQSMPRWSIYVRIVVAVLVAVVARHFLSPYLGVEGQALLALNSFQYVDWLTFEGMRILKNKLECSQFANYDFNEDFEKEFAVGETIRVPLPQRWLIRDGLEYDEQPINRIYTTVTCNQIFGIDFGWDSAEAALKMERGRERVKKQYLEPAMAQIAQEIDSRFARFAYLNTNNIVGQLGTDPTSFTTINQGRQRLVELAGWGRGGEKGLIIPPSVNTSLVAAAISYFNPSSQISQQYKDGSIGRNSGFDWYESMSLYDHTAGTWAGAVTVSGANQQGSTLTIAGTNGDTINEGDVIAVADMYAVNPSTRRVTTRATTKQFTVMANAVVAGGVATLQIQPAIFGPGSQYQNVDSLPANGAALTLFPGTVSPNGKTGKQGLFLQKDAYMIVGVKLETPKAVELSSITRDPETGIAVRFVRAWDQKLSRMTNRFDVLLGFGVGYSDNCAARLLAA